MKVVFIEPFCLLHKQFWILHITSFQLDRHLNSWQQTVVDTLATDYTCADITESLFEVTSLTG